MPTSRRNFLLAGTSLLAGAGLAHAGALPFYIGAPQNQLIPRQPGKKRVVVCGGGWGGVSAARHLMLNNRDLDVVLIERNPVFFSCPMSNKWLVDLVPTDYLIHSYLDSAARAGYTFVQGEVIDFDRDKRRVITGNGYLEYDYLVVAPGIRYNYEAWFGDDRRAAAHTRANFPAAYIPNAEHFILKRSIEAFTGGDIVLSLPPPPHRCPPSPYERACMIAARLKRDKIKGRVIILDPKESPRPITDGFQEAFASLYKDQITYVPKAAIRQVDPFNKKIVSSVGDVNFAHAVLMAPHQAGEMAWKVGAVGMKDGKTTGWADVDPLTFALRDDPDIHVIGDAVGLVSPQFHYYPKAGHVANAHGRIVAAHIAARARGETPATQLPDNLCFMTVNIDPVEDIAVRFKYHIDDKGVIIQDQHDDNFRTAEILHEDFAWAANIYADMFGSSKR